MNNRRASLIAPGASPPDLDGICWQAWSQSYPASSITINKWVGRRSPALDLFQEVHNRRNQNEHLHPRGYHVRLPRHDLCRLAHDRRRPEPARSSSWRTGSPPSAPYASTPTPRGSPRPATRCWSSTTAAGATAPVSRAGSQHRYPAAGLACRRYIRPQPRGRRHPPRRALGDVVRRRPCAAPCRRGPRRRRAHRAGPAHQRPGVASLNPRACRTPAHRRLWDQLRALAGRQPYGSGRRLPRRRRHDDLARRGADGDPPRRRPLRGLSPRTTWRHASPCACRSTHPAGSPPRSPRPTLVQIASRTPSPLSRSRSRPPRLAQGEIRTYDCQHFEPYLEPYFDTVVADQLAPRRPRPGHDISDNHILSLSN